MAVLDAVNRFRTLARFLRDTQPPDNCSKVNIAAAIAAVDQWVEDNAASYNAALPIPFRTNATASQKAILLAYLCMRRAGILRVDEDG